jgi:hypothetical protein
MRESTAYSTLRPALAKCFHVDRVENAILPGMPDVMLSANDRTIYVEMKAELGKRLRGSQIAWCLKRHKRGCDEDMFILVEDMGQFLIFRMTDVALSGGMVDEKLYHIVKKTPNDVVAFFLDVLKGGLYGH